MSGRSRTVVCLSNMAIADFLCVKREEFRTDVKSKLFKTLDTACNSLCDHPTAITSLHEAKKVRNVGPWILRMLKDFFDRNDKVVSAAEALSQESAGRKEKMKRHYCPKIHTAPFALLITLLRAHESGKEFMRKQELIDATDNSGLSERPVRANKISWHGGVPNAKDWYSGWNGMKTLTEKCLVVKTSNPGKYKLTDEGKSLARECLQKAGLDQNNNSRDGSRRDEVTGARPSGGDSGESSSEKQEDSDSDEDVQEVRRLSLRQRNNSHFSNTQIGGVADCLNFTSCEEIAVTGTNIRLTVERFAKVANVEILRPESPLIGACSHPGKVHDNTSTCLRTKDPEDDLAVPPLEAGEKFSDVYDVTCILDRREKFRMRGGSANLLQNFVESLATQFRLKVATRQVPVGDALWVARHRQRDEEYVLDFAIERKQVDDLWQSIKDNRYKQQKLRLMNCGLKRLLYLVEGNVNDVEATDSLKTSMFTTELQGGFYLLRSADPNDTCRQYGHLTLAIINRYNMEIGTGGQSRPVCKKYKEFLDHCRSLEKNRVMDVFCLQLTQVKCGFRRVAVCGCLQKYMDFRDQISHVTEDVALSIQDRFPTLSSLIQEYSKLEGDKVKQESLLQGIPIRSTGKKISCAVSKNVYKVIWAL